MTKIKIERARLSYMIEIKIVSIIEKSYKKSLV